MLGLILPAPRLTLSGARRCTMDSRPYYEVLGLACLCELLYHTMEVSEETTAHDRLNRLIFHGWGRLTNWRKLSAPISAYGNLE